MDRRLFSALIGLVPAALYGVALHADAAAVPLVAGAGLAVVAGGLHLAWRAGQV